MGTGTRDRADGQVAADGIEVSAAAEGPRQGDGPDRARAPGHGPGLGSGPGPVYDNALRQLAVVDLVAVCRWLGLPAQPDTLRLSEALPATTLYADLVVGVGPGRLAHLEFVRTPSVDLPQRMLDYRCRIMAAHPGAALTQHVLVLAGGRVPTRLSDGEDFSLRLHVTYLRRRPAATLLAHPALSPLAVLADPGLKSRATVLRQALEAIGAVTDPIRRHELTQVAAVLAAIHLDTDTIAAALREAHMPISLEGTLAGRTIEARAEARVQTGMLTALLRRAHGQDPRIPALAARLAALPQDEAIDLALTADCLDKLTERLG